MSSTQFVLLKGIILPLKSSLVTLCVLLIFEHMAVKNV